MNRRSFITGMAGILSAGYAPAFVGSSVLMPVRKIWTPKTGMEMLHEWELGRWENFRYIVKRRPHHGWEVITLSST